MISRRQKMNEHNDETAKKTCRYYADEKTKVDVKEEAMMRGAILASSSTPGPKCKTKGELMQQRK